MTAEPRKKTRRWRGWVVAGIVTVGLVAIWIGRPGPRPEPMPNPNGYDDLVAAAGQVNGDLANSDVGNQTSQALRTFVEANRPALEDARVGLGKESRVPLPAAPTQADWEAMNRRLQPMRRLARLFQSDAVLAERDGRPDVAARGFRDLIRLGRALIPGGLFNDRLVGRVYEEVGADGLARQIDGLPADRARALAAEVEALEEGHESLPRMIARDEAFAVAQQGMPGRIALIVLGKTLRAQRKAAEDHADLADRRISAKLRALAATLALRAWRLEHRDAPHPESLDALVPRYLKAVPADPFREGPMRLKFIDDRPIVYSVGPDGRDDDGRPLRLSTPSGPNPPTGDVVLPR